MSTYTVAQGRTIVLPVQWLAYEGGPAVAVTGVTIEIVPVAGPPAVVGPTAAGVTTPAVGHNAYSWSVPAAQTPADYLAIWRGTDPQGDQVTATDTVTVVAHIPVPGAYATIQDLHDHIGRTPVNAAQLLIRASRDVDRALLCAVYDPTDLVVVEKLREATLEQVAANLDRGNVTGNGGSRRGGFSIGRLTVQAASSDDAPVKIGHLWEQAWIVLQQAGLTGHGPQSR